MTSLLHVRAMAGHSMAMELYLLHDQTRDNRRQHKGQSQNFFSTEHQGHNPSYFASFHSSGEGSARPAGTARRCRHAP